MVYIITPNCVSCLYSLPNSWLVNFSVWLFSVTVRTMWHADSRLMLLDEIPVYLNAKTGQVV